MLLNLNLEVRALETNNPTFFERVVKLGGVPSGFF